MEKYDFKLTPAYCIWNGVAIKEQNGCTIKFVVTNPQNTYFCERVKNSFIKHITYVISQKDSPERYRRIPSVEFIQGTQNDIRECIRREYSPDGHFHKKEDETPEGLLIFDEIIENAVKNKITQIHIYDNKVFFKDELSFREYFFLTDNEMFHLGERIRELITPQGHFQNYQQNGFFLYGREKSVFMEASILQTINKEKGGKSSSITLQLLNMKQLPEKTEKIGFTENQMEVITAYNSQKPVFISIADEFQKDRTRILSSILYEIKKRNERNIKIISIEKSPSHFIPGIIYSDINGSKQKDDLELFQNIFKQLPNYIVTGDIFEKRTFLFCMSALKRGINIIATFPTKNIETLVSDLKMIGIPKAELFAFNNCFITKENNPEAENQKYLIDVALFESAQKKLNSKFDYKRHLLHYTNYHQILSENLRFSFMRKEKQKNIRPFPFIQHKTAKEIKNEA